MPSWKVSHRSSLTNNINVFGDMGGLTKRGRGPSTNRGTNKLVFPRGAAAGLEFMKMNNMLSKNPQCSGGIRRKTSACKIKNSAIFRSGEEVSTNRSFLEKLVIGHVSVIFPSHLGVSGRVLDVDEMDLIFPKHKLFRAGSAIELTPHGLIDNKPVHITFTFNAPIDLANITTVHHLLDAKIGGTLYNSHQNKYHAAVPRILERTDSYVTFEVSSFGIFDVVSQLGCSATDTCDTLCLPGKIYYDTDGTGSCTTCCVRNEPFWLSVWSYNLPNKKIGEYPMWTVADWINPVTNKPWVNFINCQPVSSDVSGNLYAQEPWVNLAVKIKQLTGVTLPIMFQFPNPNWTPPDTTIDDQSTAAFITKNLNTFYDSYTKLRTSSADYNKILPTEPWAISFGDEPAEILCSYQKYPVKHVSSNNKQYQLATDISRSPLYILSKACKEHYPKTIQYLNFTLIGGLLLPTPQPGVPKFKSGKLQNSPHSQVIDVIKNSSLDWISSDYYYGLSIDDYKIIYQDNIYHLLDAGRPAAAARIKILQVPWVAPCEIWSQCKKDVSINVTANDDMAYHQALDYYMWAKEDNRVVGMMPYRLKNLWGGAGDEYKNSCDNPSKTGLGLVDRCGIKQQNNSINNSMILPYALPKTLLFYKNLLTDSELAYGGKFALEQIATPASEIQSSQLRSDDVLQGAWQNTGCTNTDVSFGVWEKTAEQASVLSWMYDVCVDAKGEYGKIPLENNSKACCDLSDCRNLKIPLKCKQRAHFNNHSFDVLKGAWENTGCTNTDVSFSNWVKTQEQDTVLGWMHDVCVDAKGEYGKIPLENNSQACCGLSDCRNLKTQLKCTSDPLTYLNNRSDDILKASWVATGCTNMNYKFSNWVKTAEQDAVLGWMHDVCEDANGKWGQGNVESSSPACCDASSCAGQLTCTKLGTMANYNSKSKLLVPWFLTGCTNPEMGGEANVNWMMFKAPVASTPAFPVALMYMHDACVDANGVQGKIPLENNSKACCGAEDCSGQLTCLDPPITYMPDLYSGLPP